MRSSDFPWRPLGRLLVDDELLTPRQLERALAEQLRSGRLLGQVLVEQGQVTGTQLARALARQHGVNVRAGNATSDRVQQPEELGAWRSLGMLLMEKGLVSPTGLQQALTKQREHPDRRLGEILVECGSISPPTLASVLAEQHGVRPETELVSAAPSPRELRAAANFLDAADAACDYIDERLPSAVEIERRGAGRTEVVWTYSREQAAEAASSSKTLLETYGFDPTRWGA
jgi:hypothetical protein